MCGTSCVRKMNGFWIHSMSRLNNFFRFTEWLVFILFKNSRVHQKSRTQNKSDFRLKYASILWIKRNEKFSTRKCYQINSNQYLINYISVDKSDFYLSHTISKSALIQKHVKVVYFTCWSHVPSSNGRFVHPVLWLKRIINILLFVFENTKKYSSWNEQTMHSKWLHMACTLTDCDMESRKRQRRRGKSNNISVCNTEINTTCGNDDFMDYSIQPAQIALLLIDVVGRTTCWLSPSSSECLKTLIRKPHRLFPLVVWFWQESFC